MDPETYVRELFARYEPTAELDDFREEVLGNLRARIAQLTDEGVAAAEAARRAQTELGDIDEVAREMSRERVLDVYSHLYLRERVRPSTGRVTALVLLSVVIALGAAGLTFAGVARATGAGAHPTIAIVSGLVAAIAVGGVVLVGTTTETSTLYPLPIGRGALYGLAAAALAGGVVVGAAFVLTDWVGAGLLTGIPLLLLGMSGLIVLGVTQTNRKKPWVLREQQRQAELHVDEFSRNPQVAARFGVYTAALWTAAIVAAVVVLIAAGPLWCWLPFPLTIVAMMILIGRMGFTKKEDAE
ncbi:permease prefix domain 1-containing protein [Galbitalea sp. SE-J8]|uniref:permease prefix domain 1-containing protein n=1 Tax=Galbitalea sp. SE-J8 TaxID=3054952 RepID=UPI00259C74A7|nr:permease prefix domain 1-containing protein [Galbitalea sp. SE-J8]MDM4762749.1 permease prefix domain 1-containing protein [Galbitalea sp. SE-J8]